MVGGSILAFFHIRIKGLCCKRAVVLCWWESENKEKSLSSELIMIIIMVNLKADVFSVSPSSHERKGLALRKG